MPDAELLGSRYEVLRTVSDGRRASVLQALDRVHDRLVALKVYPVTTSDRDELLEEARLLMNMAPHPGLPVVRGDFFTDEGDRYVLVMNWVEGTDLQQVLDDQGDPGLPLRDVIGVLSDVGEALDHLHAHDPPIVHGDVKPSNLIRTVAGRVVLVDFDIAGAHAGKGRVGTIGYVAPEVAAGEKPGPQADVFGLAATAVALLNGAPPTDATPTYPGILPGEQGQIARVLRSALAVDPVRRPPSAGRMVENLRNARRMDHPSGVVALLAAEVFEATRLWEEDPDEMRAAMSRLRDVRDEVVERCGGRVVTSMNEGDRTIAVFRGASDAALAALALHEGLSQEAFPPGFEVRLRAAVAIGEAALVDGVYTGAVVDHVLGLRSVAEPGTTITSEPTAELLIGLVGRDVSIVPLGTVVSAGLPRGWTVFGLTRPGAEHSATLGPAVTDSGASSAVEPKPVKGSSRRTLVSDAVQHPATLVPMTVVGLAVIFLSVLASEVGMRGPALLILTVGALAGVGAFAWRYSVGHADRQRHFEAEQLRQDLENRQREFAQERAESRDRLDRGLARLTSDDRREARQVLDSLGQEYQGIEQLVRRAQDRRTIGISSLLPSLADETYRHGMSALSDALELLEFADGPQCRRLEEELRDIEDRLEHQAYPDTRGRLRDEQRRASREQLLTRHAESRQRARDLIFEAERCTAALAEARIELASVRAGDTQVDVDGVVETLQETIRRVRDVQDEMRRLGF